MNHNLPKPMPTANLSSNTHQPSCDVMHAAAERMLYCLPVATALLKYNGQFITANQLFADLLRTDALFLKTKMLNSFWDEQQLPWSQLTDALAQHKNPIEHELYLNGHFYLCQLRRSNYGDYGPDCVTMVCTEVTRLKRRERVLQRNNQRLETHLATDSLTGARNRLALQHMLQHMARREPTAVVSLLMIDIDDFKRYNLNYSYAQGDQLLQSMAQLLQRQLNAESQLYRVHSAGFWVSLNSASAWSAYTLAERLRLAVYEHHVEFAQASDGRVTVSIALHQDVASRCADLNVLEKQLQQRLMSAKAGGKNQVIFNDLLTQ